MFIHKLNSNIKFDYLFVSSEYLGWKFENIEVLKLIKGVIFSQMDLDSKPLT